MTAIPSVHALQFALVDTLPLLALSALSTRVLRPSHRPIAPVVRALLLGSHLLVLENLALRQQLAVRKGKRPHPRTTAADRRFGLLLRSVHDGWKDCLHLVQPTTVVRWHRQGWRWYWGRTMKGHRQGRPPIGWPLFHLIRRLQRENPTWGAPRITSELRLLGHNIGQTTVSRYMKRLRDPKRSQSWRTFLRHHLKGLAACDLFVVPTVTFQRFFVLVILSHDRRLIRHVAVTRSPTAEWTARQLVEAFPDSSPTHLIHNNDGSFRRGFAQAVEAMGIVDVPITPGHWLQNAHCERAIGTLRQDCTDHLLVSTNGTYSRPSANKLSSTTTSRVRICGLGATRRSRGDASARRCSRSESRPSSADCTIAASERPDDRTHRSAVTSGPRSVQVPILHAARAEPAS